MADLMRTMARMTRPLFWLLLLLVSVLSLIPNPDAVPGGAWISQFLAMLLFGSAEQADKVTHFLAYGSLSGCAVLGAVHLFGLRFGTPVFLICWSGVLELLQGLTQSRTPDWYDMIANSLGVVAGTLAAYLLIHLGSKIKREI